jgi:hypothetical protein
VIPLSKARRLGDRTSLWNAEPHYVLLDRLGRLSIGSPEGQARFG